MGKPQNVLFTIGKGNAKVLFDTENNIVSPPTPSTPGFSDKDYNECKKIFQGKISGQRENTTPTDRPFDHKLSHIPKL